MPHRILVVDDDEAVRSLVRDYLEDRGLRVYDAADYTQALKVIRDRQPQLVLIDFLLPKKNGFALAESIRADRDFGSLPIIMMSGVFKNPRTAVEAREKFQVLDFLSKPIDMERLHGLIRRGLRDAPELPEVDPAPEPVSPQKLEPVPVVRAGSLGPAPSNESSGPMSLELAESSPQIAVSAPPPRGLSYGSKAPPPPSASSPIVAPSVIAQTASTGAEAPARPRPVSRAAARGASVSSRPFPLMPAEGDLESHPVALLISIARYDQPTGMLDLSALDTHRRVYILRGQPIFMQSNADGENVGALLLRRGRITEPDFERCLDYMKAKKRTLQQALLDLRLATEHDLATAYKLLAGQLLPMAIGMPSGTFKWRETDAFVGRVPEGNFEPLSVLFDGIKRHVHPPQILKFFKGREDIPLRRTAEFEPLLPFFRRAFSANNVASAIDGRATYREITRSRPNDAAAVVPQLFAVVTSGMAVLPAVTDGNFLDVAVNVAAAEVAGLAEHSQPPPEGDSLPPGGLGLDDGHYSPEEERARARVVKAYQQLMSKNFYDIFGVKREDLNFDFLRDAYFKLAKQWHTDAFAGLRLGDAQRQLDELFARITEAYETLNDPAKRSEYTVFVDRQARGLPTDVAQVLEAERVCDEGLAALRRRDYRAAHASFTKATQLNAGDALYWAHLGWITFLLDQNTPEAFQQAVQLLKKAVSINENVPVAYQFMGQIFLQRNQLDDAKRWFNKCLEWEPGNIEASRGLRLITQRGGGGQGGDRNSRSSGLLSRFLSKK